MVYHRAFGVYAVIYKKGELLVIHKGRGPYCNRYDLPGGSLEEGEGLLEAVILEVKEETGLSATISRQIGAVDFVLPWKWKNFTHVHHTAVLYVAEVTGDLQVPEQFAGQDAKGATWIPIIQISAANSSPLVTQAVNWLRSGELPLETVVYSDWEVKKGCF
ncbi:NUDIX hydrolase [Terribacillus sp. DMT04]|uniref:NUDIX hydrolase n=1 Tax=Terribacillus sp. DMT04 TaxID=2850441 RepID=UPI001C2CC58F|nr:NUDIX hydrolase [Terribacillus sp. DMT04]QXE02162.1 NUDIX hydrolase [Terribacillus sp. DMT04]